MRVISTTFSLILLSFFRRARRRRARRRVRRRPTPTSGSSRRRGGTSTSLAVDGEDLRRRVERVATDDAVGMRAGVEAGLPQRVAAEVARRQRRHPREHEAAVDDALLGERVVLAVDLVEVQRVRVAHQRRELHVLRLADGLADGVREHLARLRSRSRSGPKRAVRRRRSACGTDGNVRRRPASSRRHAFAQAGRSPSLPARISALRSNAQRTAPCSFSRIGAHVHDALVARRRRLGAEHRRPRAHGVAGIARPRESARRYRRGARSPARRRRAPKTRARGSSRAGDAAADPASRTLWRSDRRRIDRRRIEKRRLEQRHHAAVDGDLPRMLVGRADLEVREQSRPYRSARSRIAHLPPKQPLGDDFVLDFARALEDAEDARVAPEALRRIFARISVAAEDLHHLRRHALGHLGGEHLGHARLEIAARARVLLLARVVGRAGAPPRSRRRRARACGG